MTSTPLWQFLAMNRPALIERWTEEVRGSIAAETVPKVELVDHIPPFIDEIIAALRRDAGLVDESPLPETSVSAGEHGAARLRLGFDIEEVVREYGLLRDVVIGLLEEAGLEVSIREFRTLSRCISTGNAEAIREFATRRDSELRKQAAEHFSFLAHELRNKLSSAKVALAILTKTGASSNERALNVADRNLNAAGDLLDDVLKQMREGANVTPRRGRIVLKELLSSIEDEWALDALAKGVELKFEVAPSSELEADERLLRSAIANLVGNGLKFTAPGGRVLVRAYPEGDRMAFDVVDGCGGLPDSMLEKLFNPYVQIGIDRSGFGLGLAIVKQVAEAHGGTIHAEGNHGNGCLFRLQLPIAAQAANG